MTSYQWSVLMSYSVLPAAVAGLLLLRRMDARFYPIVILLWMGLVNEAVSTAVISGGQTNAPNINIYLLAEALLLLWQFKLWGLFKEATAAWLLAAALMALWTWELFFNKNIFVFAHYFPLCLFGLELGMSVIFMSRLAPLQKALQKDSRFIFCACFVLFAMLAFLVELFVYGNIFTSNRTQTVLRWSFLFGNMLVNFVYLYAVLRIPDREEVREPYEKNEIVIVD